MNPSKIIILFLIFYSVLTQQINSQSALSRSYSSYQGGQEDDWSARLLEIPDSGYYNIICASVGATTTKGSQQALFAGGTNDGMIQRFDSNHNLVWSTYFGGEKYDEPTNGVLRKDNGLIVVGITSSISGIGKGRYNINYNGGVEDGFIASYSADGVLEWANYFGGPGNEVILAVATDIEGNIYVTGQTTSIVNISTDGAHQIKHGGGALEGFLAKFDSKGALIWSTYIGGTASDYCATVLVDQNGDILIGGTTFSTSAIASTDAYRNTNSGRGDAFYMKFDKDGKKLYGTYFGGNQLDEIYIIREFNDGSILIAGPTGSSTGIASKGAFQENMKGVFDIFITKIKDSVPVWSTYFGGHNWETLFGCEIDKLDNLYFCAMTQSNLNIPMKNAYQSTYGGGPWDALLFKLDSEGRLLWSSYYGGSGNDRGIDIILDTKQKLITAIAVGSKNMHSSNALDSTIGGANDVLISQFEEVDLTTNTETVPFLNDINVYPLPTAGNIIIDGEFEFYKLFKSNGEEVFKGYNRELKMEAYRSGMYFLTFYPSNIVKKVIKY